MATPTIFKFGRAIYFFVAFSRVRSRIIVVFSLSFFVQLILFYPAFQLFDAFPSFVCFCWFPLGKTWEQLGGLLATMVFLYKTSHIDHVGPLVYLVFLVFLNVLW